MKKYSGLYTKDGQPILTQEYIDTLRQQIISKNLKNWIVPQSGGQERMLSQDVDILICGGSRGGPLLVDTKVVTPFGLRRIGDMKVGDILSGLDGGMQRVISKINYGKVHSYKLKFIDGSEVIASYDHPWNIRQTCYRSKKRMLDNLRLEDDWRVWTTQMIVDRLKKEKSGEKKNGHIVIPLCKPIKFTVSAPRYGIDPYLLGVILGDGCIVDAIVKHNNIMFTTVDDEIVQAFANAGYDVHPRTSYKPSDYIFKSPEFVEALRKWKLYGHKADSKFVPRVFKFGTVEERFAILQGLMDTDGTIDKRGHCSFTTISKQLAEDVKFLVNSLGGLATITKGETFYTKDGERIQGKDAYYVYIRIERSGRIFRLERKKCLSSKYNGGISEYTRRIVDYEDLGEQDVCCIGVSNPDSLFMVEDFIVTHNSKSFSLLMEALKDIQKPDFHAIILRNNKKAMEKLIRDSKKLYFQYGTYNRSAADMTWYFDTGGTLEFKYHDDADEDFKERFQGQEYAYIGIDEITHISYKKFKYLTTCNRNAYGIRNRMWGTCNPDPRSWVRQFVDWWIDKDGYIDPKRDGVVRYCFMKGERINNIIWGDSREEVYQKAKEDIDLLWTPEYESMGLDPKNVFIQSVTFVRADLSQNPMLLLSDPSYLGRLGAQDRAQVLRDLKANWNAMEESDDLVTFDDMEAVFDNAYQYGDHHRYVTGDIALEGGDNLILWLWEGWHVKDMFVCRTDSKRTASLVKHQLKVWGVDESSFCYDGQGIGTYIKGFFPRALKFISQSAPMAEPATDNKEEEDEEDVKYAYKDLKSQCAFLLYLKIKDLGISFESSLLDKDVSGNGYDRMPLRQILQKERLVIKRDNSIRNKGFSLMPKKQTKHFIGHSPDFFDALIYRLYFELAEAGDVEIEGAWMLSADDDYDLDEQNDTLGLMEYLS